MKYFVFAGGLIFLFLACRDQNKPRTDSPMTLTRAMSGSRAEDFDRAIQKRTFIFPGDHGPHTGFRTEWWYFTGNLLSQDNHKLSYQFTIFRTGLINKTIRRASHWNSSQIYMAHFAVSDISAGEFYFAERFSREGNHLAGAQLNPLKIWLENWHIIETGQGDHFGLPALGIRAENDNLEIDLILTALKPHVLQGDQGLSQKGAQPGNASYYYSYPRLKTGGIVRIGEVKHIVDGYSWFDREWSTSALDKDQQGWDWFSLQLENNTEIMYYQMRKKDGTPDIYSKGIFVKPDGKSSLLTMSDVQLDVLDYWDSPSGIKYPSGWRMRIQSLSLDVTIIPAFKNQFLDLSIQYWEGAVNVNGTNNGSGIKGHGYVELTGYQ